MKEKEQELLNQENKRKRYLNMLFSMLRKREQITLSDTKTYFNNTEIRLIGEVLSAGYAGKRLISTRLADILGVTRSAVSQIVNKLEKQGIVRRVPDDVDKKIAYIEVTEDALEKYGSDLQLCIQFIGDVVEKFGEEKFETMYALINDFSDLLQKEKEKISKK